MCSFLLFLKLKSFISRCSLSRTEEWILFSGVNASKSLHRTTISRYKQKIERHKVKLLETDCRVKVAECSDCKNTEVVFNLNNNLFFPRAKFNFSFTRPTTPKAPEVHECL